MYGGGMAVPGATAPGMNMISYSQTQRDISVIFAVSILYDPLLLKIEWKFGDKLGFL